MPKHDHTRASFTATQCRKGFVRQCCCFFIPLSLSAANWMLQVIDHLECSSVGPACVLWQFRICLRVQCVHWDIQMGDWLAVCAAVGCSSGVCKDCTFMTHQASNHSFIHGISMTFCLIYSISMMFGTVCARTFTLRQAASLFGLHWRGSALVLVRLPCCLTPHTW